MIIPHRMKECLICWTVDDYWTSARAVLPLSTTCALHPFDDCCFFTGQCVFCGAGEYPDVEILAIPITEYEDEDQESDDCNS